MANNDTRVRITAETAQAQAALRSFGQELTGITGKFASLTGLAGTLGGALSITAFAGFIKNSIDAADRLADLAQKTGTSVEALAGLKFAADQNSTSLEAVAQASKKLSVALAENPDVLKKFGITAKDSTGALIQLADIFAAMPDGVEKTALAVKLMGKSGEEMIPFLNQGSAALRAWVEEGKRLNPITAEMAAQAKQFNDDLAKLSAQFSGLGIAIAKDSLKPLTQIASAMADAAREGGLLNAAMVGLAMTWNALFTDDLLTRQQKIAKELEKMRAALDAPNVGKHGKDAISKRMVTLQQELESLTPKAPTSPAAPKNDGRGKDLYNALNPDGKSKKDTVLQAANEAWVRDKEFQVAQLEDLRRKQEEADKAMQRSALEAQAVIFDIDPIAKASAEWEKLTALKEQGLLTDEQVAKAYQKNFEDIGKAGDDSFKRLEDAVRGWGSAFTDEMTRMVRTGKADFGSLADSIINDLIRIQIQKRVTEPLMNMGTSFLDNLNLGSMFGFADGGIMTSAGPLPLKKYASGGVASSPQLALFGEGRMNEAFVPLPDGRRIPVALQGGGAPSVTVNQTVNIDSRSDASVIMAAMAHAKDMAKAEILNSLSRGGDFARATGRA